MDVSIDYSLYVLEWYERDETHRCTRTREIKYNKYDIMDILYSLLYYRVPYLIP